MDGISARVIGLWILEPMSVSNERMFSLTDDKTVDFAFWIINNGLEIRATVVKA